MSERRYVLKKRVVLEGATGEGAMVLVDTHSATMSSCNDAASVLLQALATGATKAELATRLETEFSLDGEAAKTDGAEFLHRLSAMDLIDETA